MSSKVTLGGERLGSGKKNKIELHGYEGSTHDLGYVWRSTMAAGTLVPFMSMVGLPGDTFDINLNADIKTHPTVGPLFGSYKAQYDVFMVPMRLYNSLLHNNAMGMGMKMNKVLLPTMHIPAREWTEGEDINTAQINTSCVLRYLGIAGVGRPNEADMIREFNAIPYLAYTEIYKNYYANKQEKIGAVIHNEVKMVIPNTKSVKVNGNVGQPTAIKNGDIVQIETETARYDDNKMTYIITTDIVSFPVVSMKTLSSYNVTDLGNGWTLISGIWNKGTGNAMGWNYNSTVVDKNTTPIVKTFPLDNIDAMRRGLLAWSSEFVPYQMPTNIVPYSYLQAWGAPNIPFVYLNQEGLLLKTYQSDMFNNWLDSESIDGSGGINEITKVSTQGDGFTIDSLNLAKKVYYMLNRINVSGGSFNDWINAVYDHESFSNPSTPVYVGGLSKELVFQEVVSNADTEGNPLGTLAGKGIMSEKHKGGNILVRCNEPCYIMGIVSLTPRVDYSQGNTFDVNLKTIDDLHKPQLDEIGFQDLIEEKMTYWTTAYNGEKWIQQTVGKVPAWLDYMTNVNRSYGNFAEESEMFMTLNRRYEYATDGGVVDMTSYIDPVKFNFIFADTARDAQNFWSQIAVNITARRKMSAKVMPNL